MACHYIRGTAGHGAGLRRDFDWDPNKIGSNSPHLTADAAQLLMAQALDQYEQVMHQTPARIVVHKTSRYWPDERDGFRAAIESRVRRYDLMALEPQSTVRLMTTSKYPPLRGTRFTIGDLDYLYTTGYIAALNEFHGMHVPAPLQVADHIGKVAIQPPDPAPHLLGLLASHVPQFVIDARLVDGADDPST